MVQRRNLPGKEMKTDQQNEWTTPTTKQGTSHNDNDLLLTETNEEKSHDGNDGKNNKHVDEATIRICRQG
jgi:hypothetical protein